MSKKYIYKLVPENIDIKKLLNEKPFKGENKKSTPDYMHYLLGSIYDPFIQNKDLMDKTCYAPLCATILKYYVNDYKSHLVYLEEAGVIEGNYSYLPGVFTKGYRFTGEYRGVQMKWVSISTWPLIKKIIKYRFERDNFKKRPYLNQWFNGNLKIDINGAKEYNEKKYFAEKKRESHRRRNGKRYPLSAEERCVLRMNKIMQIAHQSDEHGYTDQTSLRYHSNITRLDSGLRNYLNYNGQRLISWDIKNAQLYFSTAVACKEFQQHYGKASELVDLNTVVRYNPNLQKGFTSKRKKEYHEKLWNNYSIQVPPVTYTSTSTSDTIMFLEPSQSVDTTGVSMYKKLCSEGQLYEYMLKKMLPQKPNLNRDQVKHQFLTFLFAEERDAVKWCPLFNQVFKKEFPAIYNLFNGIKKHDHTLLAILLQSIESYAVLDVVAKRFSKECPNAPLYTIHDSMVTTVEYADRLKLVMEEELTRCIGIPPTLKKEEWKPEKATNN